MHLRLGCSKKDSPPPSSVDYRIKEKTALLMIPPSGKQKKKMPLFLSYFVKETPRKTSEFLYISMGLLGFA